MLPILLPMPTTFLFPNLDTNRCTRCPLAQTSTYLALAVHACFQHDDASTSTLGSHGSGMLQSCRQVVPSPVPPGVAQPAVRKCREASIALPVVCPCLPRFRRQSRRAEAANGLAILTLARYVHVATRRCTLSRVHDRERKRLQTRRHMKRCWDCGSTVACAAMAYGYRGYQPPT